jgi:hypothetical protein
MNLPRLLLASLYLLVFVVEIRAEEPTTPKEPIKLLNGRDLTGFTTWLKDTKLEDPRKVFQVEGGVLHASGDGFGYAATDREYRDYHLSLEYKWGKRTDGGKYVRNSGVLLHGTGAHGNAGAWMASIECQLAQGCCGDLIPIRGKDAKGAAIPVEFKSETVLGSDRRPRWKKGGDVTTFTNKQLWWNNHDPTFKELLDTRGKDDVESPLGEWTKVECICDGKRITIRVNGHTVNEAFDVNPSAGKILLQCEGHEVYFRNVEIRPIEKK